MRKLGDWLDTYLKYTYNTEPIELYRKWVGIHMLAATMQRKCYMHHGMKQMFPNLYIVLVGRSGNTRKGTAIEPALDFLYQKSLGLKLAAESMTREALIVELKNSLNVFMSKEGKLSAHSSLNILSPELAVFLGHKNSTMLSDLTDWFDCRNPWTYRTKGSGTFTIDAVWVNILGATTPELIQMMLPMEAIGGGLTSRVIFVFAANKEKDVVEPTRTQEEIETRKHLIHDLEDICQLGGEFIKTPEYKEIWEDWYPKQSKKPPFNDTKFDAYCGRRQDYIMKLSMIFSTSRGNSRLLTGEDILRSIETLNEVEIPMTKALSGIGRASNSEITAKIMLDVSMKKQIQISEIMQKYSSDIGKQELDQILMTLETMKFCTFYSNTGKIVWNPNFGINQSTD